MDATTEQLIQRNFAALTDRLARAERRIRQLEVQDVARGIRARVYNSANISIATATPTALTFDTETYDGDGFHSLVTNTGRLTIPFDGYYLVGVQARFASNATGYRQVFPRLNGTTAFGGMVVNAVGTNVTDIFFCAPVHLVAGDYLEFLATQTSGGNLNVGAVADFSPVFWIEKLID
jgi:hypothetical protein